MTDVYLPQNSSSNVYHTNHGCRYVNDNPRTLTQSMAESWGYSECTVCNNGSITAYTSNDQSKTAIDK